MNMYNNKLYDDAMYEHKQKMEKDLEYRERYLKSNSQEQCGKCKKITSINSKFCPNCGNQLRE